MEEKIAEWKKRPVSWSQISSWEYNPDQWFSKYVLNKKPDDNKEMAFGRNLAESLEHNKCKIPELVKKLPYKKEHPFKVNFNGITLVGFADDFDDKSFKVLNEVKTGKRLWDQRRTDQHQQFDMYLLMNYITNKISPEDVKCTLFWIPTEETGDFHIKFVEPITVHQFVTRRSMTDILQFGAKINETRRNMEAWARRHLSPVA